MQCLKCGQETQDDQVFCQHCLEKMEEYPVKPGTAIHLPNRAPDSASKRIVRRKRAPSLEDQLAHMKTMVHRLAILAVVLGFALAICAALLCRGYLVSQVTKLTGRNYTIQTSETP